MSERIPRLRHWGQKQHTRAMREGRRAGVEANWGMLTRLFMLKHTFEIANGPQRPRGVQGSPKTTGTPSLCGQVMSLEIPYHTGHVKWDEL